eukprot:GHVS01016094.1.p1 GENE.GHVS01016094.1~~GHVS01016094.1.p1  ORF type:complete len:495 (+),score=200.64 GHVS01016094.1:245-1729(+)
MAPQSLSLLLLLFLQAVPFGFTLPPPPPPPLSSTAASTSEVVEDVDKLQMVQPPWTSDFADDGIPPFLKAMLSSLLGSSPPLSPRQRSSSQNMAGSPAGAMGNGFFDMLEGTFGATSFGPSTTTEVEEEEGVCVVTVDMEGLPENSKVEVSVDVEGRVTIDYSMREETVEKEETAQTEKNVEEEEEEEELVSTASSLLKEETNQEEMKFGAIEEESSKDKPRNLLPSSEEQVEVQNAAASSAEEEKALTSSSSSSQHQAPLPFFPFLPSGFMFLPPPMMLTPSPQQQLRSPSVVVSSSPQASSSSSSSSTITRQSSSSPPQLAHLSEVFSSKSFLLDRRCDASDPTKPKAVQHDNVIQVKFPLLPRAVVAVVPKMISSEKELVEEKEAPGLADEEEEEVLLTSSDNLHKQEEQETMPAVEEVEEEQVEGEEVKGEEQVEGDSNDLTSPPVLPHLRSQWHGVQPAAEFRKAQENHRSHGMPRARYVIPLVRSDEF